jgi:8-oxo-dGTP diphosphatase
MIEFVVGFLFSSGKSYVALQRKTALHSQWQDGQLNGVGGKVLSGETPLDAMKREWTEECHYPFDQWKQFAEVSVVNQGDVNVTVYYFMGVDIPNQAIKLEDKLHKEDEPIYFYHVNQLYGMENLIPDLKFLIPMALCEETGKYKKRAVGYIVREVYCDEDWNS